MMIGSALVALGCIAESPYMSEPKVPIPTVAPADSAVVVFLRPSAYGSSVATTILDDKGAFLGDSISGTQFAVVVPPGPHLFLAWAENTAPLSASLLAGRVYFVEVSPRFGFWSPRVQLLAITPRGDSWRELGRWLSQSTQMIPDLARGQAYVNERRADALERVRRARERLTELSPSELDERTLLPHDGVVTTHQDSEMEPLALPPDMQTSPKPAPALAPTSAQAPLPPPPAAPGAP